MIFTEDIKEALLTMGKNREISFKKNSVQKETRYNQHIVKLTEGSEGSLI